ncbi:MAG TPA: tRNA (adenosine(37)-N6)-threonylcarbamoyltransferase complex dimerization subunit type 1 TsaB, partial [Pararhizobium sp.]|nr:tRNA (adenosine(37)-N6)-threonylcarbamoyltransferase complex dimerization subunit type 1 TsaB [Pararhizobium sp.]
LALGVPCVGVGSLEAIGIPLAVAHRSSVLAVSDARRGEVYAELFDDQGLPMNGPAAMTPSEAAGWALSAGASLAGSGAGIVAASAEEIGNRPSIISDNEAVDIAAVARLAAGHAAPFEKPKPLYLRGADAKPQTGFAVARKA